MKRQIACYLMLGLLGCSRSPQTPAKQGSTQWQVPPGSKWVNRPLPTWPPTAQGDFVPIDPAELEERLPQIADARLVEKAHTAGDNPFVAQASLCIDDADGGAVTARVQQTLAAAGWQATDLASQLGAASATVVQMTHDAYVLTAYAAPGRWTGCDNPKQQTYLTFVAGKRK